MITITEYDESTGELGFIKSFSDEETYELNNANPHVMGAFSSQDYYVVGGEAAARPASPITLNGMMLMNVPPGATVLLDGQEYSAEGDVELEFPLPGTYRLRVECFPYLEWTAEVVVP